MSKVAKATDRNCTVGFQQQHRLKILCGVVSLLFVAIAAFLFRSPEQAELPISQQNDVVSVAQGGTALSPPETTATETPADTFPDGEPKQYPEFEKIAAALFKKSEFFGEGKSDSIRAELANSEITKGQQILLLRQLALALLEEGKAKESTEVVDQLMNVVREVPVVLERNPQLFAVHALSYLRLSEVENCISRHNAECCLFPLAGGGIHGVKDPAKTARKSYLEYLDRRPNDYAVKWLLNLTSMAIGDHPDALSPENLIPPEAFESEYDIKRFPDIASKLGINTFNLCGGCIVDDFDGDQLLDIATSTIDPEGPIRFYHNNGDGTFDDRSEASRPGRPTRRPEYCACRL